MIALALCLSAASPVQAQTYTMLHGISSIEGGAATYPALLAQGRDGDIYGATDGGNTLNCCGSVFRMTPSGAFTILHTFTGIDGSTPLGGLTLGTDGNLYGTTETGGTYGLGTIFKMTPAGALTTLYNFSGSTDGVYPLTPPVQGKNGNFYGTTYYGSVYSINSSGTFKALPGTVPGRSFSPLLLASDGNFYGTTPQGPGQGTVFRLSPSGVVTVIYTFDGTHGSAPYGGVVQGSDGLLYGTTSAGGSIANPGGVVFKMTLSGAITVIHEFDSTSTTDGYEPIAGLVAASDGNLYGSTAFGNGASAYGALFKISRSGSYSPLYVFDNTQGANPYATQMQHTNGLLFGMTFNSGIQDVGGVIYSLNNSLKRYAALLSGFGAAGQTVQILGTGLTGTTSVKFGAGSATFTVFSDNFMTAVVPSNGTTGAVTISTPTGTLTSNKKFMVTPVISSFTPTSGPVGTQVTINGTGLLGTNAVAFGGVLATAFTVNSGTQVTATVPAGAVTGKVALRTAGGTASSSTNFTVQ